MKVRLVSGAFALSLALSGVATAADAPAPAAPPPPADPVAGFFNPLFAPIGTILDPLGPMADAINKPIGEALAPPAAPAAPAAPAPKKHRHHRKHRTA